MNLPAKRPKKPPFAPKLPLAVAPLRISLPNPPSKCQLPGVGNTSGRTITALEAHSAFKKNMKTSRSVKTKATTVATTRSKTPAAVLNADIIKANHASIYRLAEQLDRSPHELAADILSAGIRAIDWSLGERRELDWPLHMEITEPASSERDRISETLNSASPVEMAMLEAEGNGIPQAALLKRKTTAVRIRAEIVEPLQAILDASETNMTVGEYLQQSVAPDLLESFAARRYGMGVQDWIGNSFQLEPGDMERMNIAAIQWATRNPAAVTVIESLK